MPAQTPVPPPRRGPPRDVDSLIRDLQRINLSQCLDQLYADMSQLDRLDTDQPDRMEEDQLPTWSGLYVRCPGPEPDDLCADPTDKKSSSGYSTESASPPGSQDFSDDVNVANLGVELAANDDSGGVGCAALAGRSGGQASGARPRLIQTSVSHSARAATVTPLTRDPAAFCPPAASTPTLASKHPRSPKTLRFAATHELIPPDSPARRKTAVVTPRPGILRSRAGHESPSPRLANRNRSSGRAPVGYHGTSWSSKNGALPHDAPDLVPKGHDSFRGPGAQVSGAGESGRVVSAVSRLEASVVLRDVPRSRGRVAACGTPQFVGTPRRQMSFSGQRPALPRDPLVMSTSATDTESDSDSEDTDQLLEDRLGSQTTVSRYLLYHQQQQQRQLAEDSDSDFSSWRRTKLPPVRGGSQLRPGRRQLSSWLLSCGSRRRPPSPPSTYLTPPPGPAAHTPAASVLYKCNLCKASFPEHFMLVAHVKERHARVQVRPKYSCGLCPARFYASRVLAKHCAYHHTSMGDKRTPQCLKARRGV